MRCTSIRPGLGPSRRESIPTALRPAIVAALAGSSSALAAPTYGISDLGVLDGTSASTPYGLNAAGQVVGGSGDEDEARASVWRAGAMTKLGTLPGGTESFALGINASGQAVGYSGDDNDNTRAVPWQGGTDRDLGTLPGGDFSQAAGIIDAGEGLGRVFAEEGDGDRDEELTDFSWSGADGIVSLSSLVADISDWQLLSAQASNEATEIVGHGFNAGAARGFLLTSISEAPSRQPLPFSHSAALPLACAGCCQAMRASHRGCPPRQLSVHRT